MDRLSVLIVGNSPQVHKELESVLTDFDPLHAQRSVKTPQEALGVAQTFRPDVIIYDLPLGGPTDAAFIARLKALLVETRIIAISLYDHYGEAALKSGADEFVPKTASRSVLLAALTRQARSAGHKAISAGPDAD